jgi:hypothetical protein
MLSAAVHESASGPFRTSRDVRSESAFGGKAEVEIRDRHVSFRKHDNDKYWQLVGELPVFSSRAKLNGEVGPHRNNL